MNKLLEVYQQCCPYTITDNVQLLDYKVDINTLRNDMFNLIINNNYGFDAVSLRMPPGVDNFVAPGESLTDTASAAYTFYTNICSPVNSTPNEAYTEWHSDLKDSYITTIVADLEKLCGFKIGRIRLGWLMPGSGYPIHQDPEPLRLHIPLLTNNNAYIIHEHKLYHMEYGNLYHLITPGIHTAWNFGKLPRLHLIFSTYGDSQFEQVLQSVTSLEQLQDNFEEHIKGVDRISLAYLFKIFSKNADQKDQLLFDMKSILKYIN